MSEEKESWEEMESLEIEAHEFWMSFRRSYHKVKEGHKPKLTHQEVEDLIRSFLKREKKAKEEEREKILEWHKLVNIGLVNGLSFTYRDGRTDNIGFWKRRNNLFNAFALCIQDLITEQDYKYSEKDLKEISELGWKNE